MSAATVPVRLSAYSVRSVMHPSGSRERNVHGTVEHTRHIDKKIVFISPTVRPFTQKRRSSRRPESGSGTVARSRMARW